MMTLYQNQATTARRRVPLLLTDDADGKTPKTGLLFAPAEVKVSKNGGAEASSHGTVTEVGGGLYTYEFSQDELDTPGFVSARVVKTGVRSFVAAHQVLPAPPDAGSIADRVLGRSIAGGSDGGRTVAQALAFSRNRVEIDSTSTPPMLTVYDVDDATVLWRARVTTAKGDPLTGVDPT
jgi:hypothetical protein